MPLIMAGERWNIDAGELNKRVQIQTKEVALTKTGRGATTRDWNIDGAVEVWAKVEVLSGRKLELARQLVATASHMVTMRYNPDRILDSKENRILYKGRVLNIGHANNVEERGVRLEVLCTELRGEMA